MDQPRLEPLVVPPEGLAAEAHWIVVRSGHVVLGFDGDNLPFGVDPPLGGALTRHFLGTIGNNGVWAVDIEVNDPFVTIYGPHVFSAQLPFTVCGSGLRVRSDVCPK